MKVFVLHPGSFWKKIANKRLRFLTKDDKDRIRKGKYALEKAKGLGGFRCRLRLRIAYVQLILDEVVGQKHILGSGRALRKIIDSGETPMVFYGPSGVGKTTVASIIAKNTGRHLVKLNGTTASTADIKDAVARIDTFEGINGILLYLDEIQYFNKKQQQTLLEFIENGSITLIASTTENPYFYVYNAILSRSTVFEFKPVEQTEIEKGGRAGFFHSVGGKTAGHCT